MIWYLPEHDLALIFSTIFVFDLVTVANMKSQDKHLDHGCSCTISKYDKSIFREPNIVMLGQMRDEGEYWCYIVWWRSGVSGNPHSCPFPGMKASDSRSRTMGMIFSISFPLSNFRNAFFIPFAFLNFGNVFFSFSSPNCYFTDGNHNGNRNILRESFDCAELISCMADNLGFRSNFVWVIQESH